MKTYKQFKLNLIKFIAKRRQKLGLKQKKAPNLKTVDRSQKKKFHLAILDKMQK